MFDLEIKELYKHLTKQELKDQFSIVKSKRKSMVQYVTLDYRWVLAPIDSKITLDNYKQNYKIKDSTRLFFIENINFGDVLESELCRELTKEDESLFIEFKNNCSKEDQDEGMVSLEDDFIYGLFTDGKIVAISSLWNWGNILSDIGVLVHPKYRKKGYSKAVCQTLMQNIDRKFVWRCDEKNIGSFNLAKSIGFVEIGLIQELVLKD